MATWRTRYANSAMLDLVVTATESEVNVANNTSKVTVTVQLKSSSSTTAWNQYPQNLSVTIDGKSAGGRSFTYSVPSGGTVTLGTYSSVVAHNGDGTKSARIQVSASGGGDSGSIDQTLVLTTIARASIPTVSKSSVELGTSVKIYFNRKSSSFRHKLVFEFMGSDYATLATTASDVNEFTWTLPTDLANRLKNSTSNGGLFRLETYNGTTHVGTKYVSITVVIPNNSTYNPTITQPSWSETVSEVSTNFAGMIIDGRSKVKFTSTASTKYGATVSNVQIRFTKSTGGSWTFNADVSGTTATYLWNANDSRVSWSIQMIVTDSRGRTATSPALNIGVTGYSAPRIIKATANRSSSVATNLILNLSATGSSLGGKNLMTLNVFIKQKTSTTWGIAKYSVGATNGTITLTNHMLSGYAETSGFDVKFQLYDKLTPVGTVDSIVTIRTTKILFGAYKDMGVAIGGMYNPSMGGALQVVGSIILDGTVDLTNNTALRGRDTSGTSRRLIHKGLDDWVHINPDTHGRTKIWGTLEVGAVNNAKIGNVVWTGVMFVHDQQTVTVSQPLSECENGWILVWSHYAGNNTGSNHNYTHTVIHKDILSYGSNIGLHQIIGTQDFGIKTKYIYVSNSTITGNARNANDDIVLRKVITW